MDITPNDIAGVIDLNIKEESAISELMAELQGRFPDQPVEWLRDRVRRFIERGARSGALGFYSGRFPGEQRTGVSPEDAVASLSRPDVWVAGGCQLVAYEKNG